MGFILGVLLSVITTAACFKDCNFSQYDFFSNYSLGKQNELNRTFQILNKKVGPLPDVTYSSQIFRYVISQAKSAFLYLDGKQNASIVSDDIITIGGGNVDASLSFNWSKNATKGTGTAVCRSSNIAFAKLLYFQQGFINYKVADYINVSFFRSTCSVSRVDPVLESPDLDILNNMLNYNNNSNVKTKLEEQIAKYYLQALSQSLYDERQPINNQSEYTWIDPTPGKTNLTIKYTLVPVGGHLQKAGLSFNFVTQITDDPNWKCGATVPSQPKDPKIYGGVQQYLSLSILQNSIRYAVQMGQLDTKLNKQNWQSKVFQFYAGDLYQIIPFIATKYYANQPVSGDCKATTTNLKLTKSTNSSLLLSMHYSCRLLINNVVISQFQVDPNFIIKTDPQQTYLDFYIVKVSKFAHFKDVGDYVIHDLDIANLFITRCLQRLYQGKVFGSGWKIYARDYPSVEFSDGLMFIYDSAAIA